MSIAGRVVWEMLGGVFEDTPEPTTVIPFPLAKRNPRKCRKERRATVQKLGRCPGTLGEVRALVDECNACRSCFNL